MPATDFYDVYEHTIEEIDDPSIGDFLCVDILTTTSYALVDRAYEVEPTKVIEAFVSINDGDDKRLATPDECKAIQKFINEDKWWTTFFEKACCELIDDEYNS